MEIKEETKLRTPYYLIDEALLKKNLEILKEVSERSGCRILLAQKAFSMFSVYPLLRQYLAGSAASGLYEARLGKEEFGGETHVFSAAYREDEFEEILTCADHVVFNTPSQVKRFGAKVKQAGKEAGLRLNPQCSTQEGHAIYDPCAPGSRMGTTEEMLSSAGDFETEILPYLSGFHFHTLCEQNSDALEVTLEAVEQRFGHWLSRAKWLNLGGGHHITRADYDRERLIRLILGLREKYGVTVYLEPGEAVVLNAGFLVTTVLETMENGMYLAILDTSAACHMPDVLEMPYRPPLSGSGMPGEKKYTYRLGGPTCLSGDVIGEYSFDTPLRIGQQLVFEDMALYTMVKNNTFNGMPLPSIVLRTETGECKIIKKFGYEDFKGRLS
ncbi:MAG: carboxynorspermidine decarboxylase [Clostridium sp.]|nr:carboxynorspermidine decarboxylase [Clostridium sp.]